MRRVDRIARRPVVEHVDHLQGHIDGHLLLGLDRAAAQMGREDDVLALAQRIVGGQRLVDEDIERGAGHMARLQGRGQIGFVDHAAARDVENAHARLGRLQAVGVDQVACLFGQRHVAGDEVGLSPSRSGRSTSSTPR